LNEGLIVKCAFFERYVLQTIAFFDHAIDFRRKPGQETGAQYTRQADEAILPEAADGAVV
jgi:hypothetical protein